MCPDHLPLSQRRTALIQHVEGRATEGAWIACAVARRFVCTGHWLSLFAAVGLTLSFGMARAETIYVDPAAPGPVRDGRAWGTAYSGVWEALRVAQRGDTVAVAQGTYAEEIVLKDGVRLHGGYAGSADPSASPDLLAYPTVLTGLGGPAPVVYASGGVSTTARLEGFQIVPGDFTTTAVLCSQASPTITRNLIREAGMAVNCGAGSLAIVTCNVIQDSGFGVYTTGSSPVIAGNLVTGCEYGIHTGKTSSPPIINNTVAENTTGMDLASGTPDVRNNIVALNQTGVRVFAGGTPQWSFNCVSGNDADYDGMADPVGTRGNIAVAPGFVDPVGGNFRVAATSGCVDAGDDSVVNIPETDLDNRPRKQGDRVDLGAYEAAPPAQPAGEALRRAGGLAAATSGDLLTMDALPPAGIDIVDAVLLTMSAK